MQVFEFHFNPEKEIGLHFNSFCFTPNNIYEKKLGNLYLIGELKRAFEKKNLLQQLAKETKDNYYRLSGHSIDKAFNKSIEKANEFLQEKKDKAEVSWMGNLGFTIVSLKDKELRLTKTGDTKVFLLRGDKKIDIDSQFNKKGQIESSSKEFKNIASSKLAQNDILILATEDVAKVMKEGNIFDSLIQSIPLSEKKIRRIFYRKQIDLSQLKGSFILLSLNKNKNEHIKKILPAPSSSKFSFEKISVSGFSKIKNLISGITLPKIPRFSIKKPDLNLTLPQLPSFSIEKINLRPIKFKKNIFLLVCFCLLLLIGFYLFKRDRQQKLMAFKDELAQIRTESEKAEQLLQNNKKEEGQKILLDSLKEISSLETQVSLPKDVKKNITNLQDEIKKELEEANNLEKIKEVDKLTSFKPEDFTPQNIILNKSKIYFSSPFEDDLQEVRLDDLQTQKISNNEKIEFAFKLNNQTPIFITKEGNIQTLDYGSLSNKGKISLNTEMKDFMTYSNNLYFLSKKGEIKKSSYLGNMKWDTLKDWLSEKEKSTAGKVFAVDKNIWVFDKQDRIKRYYRGELEETIETNLYPEIENIVEFYTNNDLEYLYLLASDSNRIIIFNKDGTISKQIQCDKFNNPIDFSISEDGKVAYLLTSELELISVDLL